MSIIKTFDQKSNIQNEFPSAFTNQGLERQPQIYDEVLSQLGTRISGWLGDEEDVHAVLSGLAGRESLRGMLTRLQPREEVLLLGWGVPMPLPVRFRRYDDTFWHELFGATGKRSRDQNLKELGF